MCFYLVIHAFIHVIYVKPVFSYMIKGCVKRWCVAVILSCEDFTYRFLIVKNFFGIGCQEMTLEEIGEKFNLTRERVRQIKEKAIRKLRNSARSKLLQTYLG